MADDTKIEWADATWQPITGCSVVSPGCTNCYAMRLAGGRLKHEPSRAGLTAPSNAGPVWTGEVRSNRHWLDQPLKWQRPRRIFVCAHGDLFHEGAPDEWIDQVLAVMALCPQHTFLVLTKRAARMRAYFSRDRRGDWLAAGVAFGGGPSLAHGALPLPNVWLGVSVEDQVRADERIPELLASPAVVRWASYEPALGSVDCRHFLLSVRGKHGQRVPLPMFDSEEGRSPPHGYLGVAIGLDWVVAGGESGPGARPCDIDWLRTIVAQCREAGVPCFVKQMGADPYWHCSPGVTKQLHLRDRKGSAIDEWPADLQVREWPNG